MSTHPASRLALALTTTAVLACGTDAASPVGGAVEPTARQAAALAATSYLGTSLAPKTLSLTFDDGPGYGTSDISTYLAAHGIPATFFVNGAYITATTLPNDNGIKLTPNATALLAQLVADGHLVANHATTHRSLAAVLAGSGAAKVVQEVAETDDDIAGYVPGGHFLFRAPYGYYDANVWSALAPTAMNKYVGTVGWDIGGTTSNYPAQAADWACWVNGLQTGGAGATFGATPQQCGDAYLSEITAVGRGIVLMHDSSHTDNGGTTLAMVEYLVPILVAQGYTFVRADAVPELAALFPPVPCDPSCATCSGASASRCTSCKGGAWLSGGTCRACTACGAGSYQAAACAADADARCVACAAGSYASSGASGCTSCGSCDDGDRCTTDACDVAKGCTHSPIDGCAPGPPSSPVADGSTRDATPASGEDAGEEPTTTTDAAAGGGSGGCSIAPAAPRSASAADGAFAVAIGMLAAARLLRRRASASSSERVASA